MYLGSFAKENDFQVQSVMGKASTYGDEGWTFQAEEQQNQRTGLSIFSGKLRILAGPWEELGSAGRGKTTEASEAKEPGLHVVGLQSPVLTRSQQQVTEKAFVLGHIVHQHIKWAEK